MPLEKASNVLGDEEANALRNPKIDVPALQRRLRAAVAGEVRFDEGSRALYGSDASNYRQIPIGVVIPKSIDDVAATLTVCRDLGVPVLCRGGGTSQNGQCVNVAVVIDYSKNLNRVLEIDTNSRTALVEPGVICDQLREDAEHFGLTFGPDPATHSRCTIGGMIGNNSCGAHSVMAGKTIENLEELEVLTYEGTRFWAGPTSEAELAAIVSAGGRRGEIYSKLIALRDKYADVIRAEFPRIRRRVSGFNLEQLLPENGFNVARALVGTEGTCAVTLRARVRLVSSPPVRVLLGLGFEDVFTAADASPYVMSWSPVALEGLDEAIVGGLRERGLKLDDIAMLPQGKGWLIVEFGADSLTAAEALAVAAMEGLAKLDKPPTMRLWTNPGEQQRIWSIRELGASANAMSSNPEDPDPIVGWEDAAVDPAKLGDYLRAFQNLIDQHGYKTCLYGHFGDGCIHARINFDLRSEAGLARMRDFLRAAAALVVKFGGSLSGEHGDGQAKAEFLPLMFGPQLMQAFREFKAIWDPGNRMNPGKVVDAYRVDDNLRVGPDYQPAVVNSHFSFRRNRNSFSRAIEHCIGMARCRSPKGGLMCPSYRASGDEGHSTRGRSRLLFEMLRGEVIKEGWQSEEVKSALEHCLACKGCRSECPTHVDMATYKAEFLSHYYEGKRRPIAAYTMGLIHRWAPWAARVSRVANTVNRIPGLRRAAKRILGVAPQRSFPRIAGQTFRRWFEKRPASRANGPKVILWPDTFTNHFHPEAAKAAVEVIESFGYRVELPAAPLCCGRALYDFGMLDDAKALLRAILESLRAEALAGTKIVGLEPACVAVFRDELTNLFPDDPVAIALSRQVRLFSEFILESGKALPKLPKRLIVHGHCHEKSLSGMTSNMELLKRLGATIEMPEAGCCGMAGAFGFSRSKFELSMKIAERALLPAVRRADSDTLIVADGYSCREQIEQGAGRRPMHSAEVVHAALNSRQSSW